MNEQESKPRKNKYMAYWGVKEKLLSEQNYIVPKPSRTEHFQAGFLVGAIIGALVTVVVVLLLFKARLLFVGANCM